MKKPLFFLGAFSLILLFGCSLNDGSIEVDPDLVDSWVMTDGFGGPWEDSGGSPHYMGFRFAAGGKIYMIYSDDGVDWDEVYLGTDLTKAENGEWASNAGGYGTYNIIGDDLVWINNATAITMYFARL